MRGLESAPGFDVQAIRSTSSTKGSLRSDLARQLIRRGVKVSVNGLDRLLGAWPVDESSISADDDDDDVNGDDGDGDGNGDGDGDDHVAMAP